MISALDPTAATAASTVSPKTMAAIQKSATDFEAVFATQMLTHMYEGMQVDQTFGGGRGEEMFRTVLLDQYGKQMAQNDSLGIVKQVSAQMLKIQEGQNHGNH
jgi:Rod binding domain-containing protein